MAGMTAIVGFPSEQPSQPPFHHGWFLETHIRVFQAVIQPTTKVIIELGSWYGASTRWFVENSNAKIYAIDLWDDSFILNDNHYNRSPELKSMLRSHPLYSTFLANLWEYKDRVIPIKMNTLDGLQYLYDQGIIPDIIYIDADHHYQAAKNDIMRSLELFPRALLVGDDYGNYEDVRKAVHECANEFMKTVHVDNNHCWAYCCLNSLTGCNIAPKIKSGKLSNLMNRYKNSLAHLSTDKVITTGEPDAIEKKRNSQDVTHDETSAVDNKRKRDEEEKEEGERYKELKTDVGSSGLEQETIPRPTEI